MRLPLQNVTVTYQDVIAHGKLKYPIPFIITLVITIAFMDNLITTRRGAKMTIQITKKQ